MRKITGFADAVREFGLVKTAHPEYPPTQIPFKAGGSRAFSRAHLKNGDFSLDKRSLPGVFEEFRCRPRRIRSTPSTVTTIATGTTVTMAVTATMVVTVITGHITVTQKIRNPKPLPYRRR